MKRHGCIALFLFCFLSVAPIAEASDLFGTIRLRGQPLGDVEISLKSDAQELKARTKESGYYSIRNQGPVKNQRKSRSFARSNMNLNFLCAQAPNPARHSLSPENEIEAFLIMEQYADRFGQFA